MAKQDDIPKTAPSEIEALIERVKRSGIEPRDAQLVERLLRCVATMCTARSESAIAEWGRNYGQKWLRRLGIKRKTSPSQPTIHRVRLNRLWLSPHSAFKRRE